MKKNLETSYMKFEFYRIYEKVIKFKDQIQISL